MKSTYLVLSNVGKRELKFFQSHYEISPRVDKKGFTTNSKAFMRSLQADLRQIELLKALKLKFLVWKKKERQICEILQAELKEGNASVSIKSLFNTLVTSHDFLDHYKPTTNQSTINDPLKVLIAMKFIIKTERGHYKITDSGMHYLKIVNNEYMGYSGYSR